LPAALFGGAHPHRDSNADQDTQAVGLSDLDGHAHAGNPTVTNRDGGSHRDAYSDAHSHSFADLGTADSDQTASHGHPDPSPSNAHDTSADGDAHRLLSVLPL
jgi:hypothetical protein